MSIHTEKPNPRLSTKPVTTPENATSFFVARRVDGVRFSDRRVSQASQRWRGALPQRFRVDGVEVVPPRRHRRNTPMAWVDAKGLEVADADAMNEPKNCLYFKYPCVFLRFESRNGRRPDGLERLARLPQLVALRLDEVVRLLRVLVEGLLDLIEFALLRLRFSLSSIDVLL